MQASKTGSPQRIVATLPSPYRPAQHALTPPTTTTTTAASARLHVIMSSRQDAALYDGIGGCAVRRALRKRWQIAESASRERSLRSIAFRLSFASIQDDMSRFFYLFLKRWEFRGPDGPRHSMNWP